MSDEPEFTGPDRTYRMLTPRMRLPFRTVALLVAKKNDTDEAVDPVENSSVLESPGNATASATFADPPNRVIAAPVIAPALHGMISRWIGPVWWAWPIG